MDNSITKQILHNRLLLFCAAGLREEMVNNSIIVHFVLQHTPHPLTQDLSNLINWLQVSNDINYIIKLLKKYRKYKKKELSKWITNFVYLLNIENWETSKKVVDYIQGINNKD